MEEYYRKELEYWDELATDLTKDYKDKRPIIISVLSGAVLFTVDMIERLDIMAQIDFIDVSSYFGGLGSTGKVKLIHDLKTDVKDRHVLIMEDIVDTGRTLKYLMDLLADRGAKSIKVCSLLNKPEGRKVDVENSFQSDTWVLIDLFQSVEGKNPVLLDNRHQVGSNAHGAEVE